MSSSILEVIKNLKAVLSGLRQFLATESRLKMKKNTFYFTLNALFVLKIFKILSSIFGMYKNGLMRKIRIILKFITSQPGKQAIAIHILPSISWSKGNQTMKCGQFIEYQIRKMFVKKSYKKCGGETLPRPFSKKSKLSISLDQLPKVSYSLLLLYAKLSAIEIYWNQTADHLLLPHTKLS